MDGKVIELTLMGESAFCFNADDYMTIRAEHRIVGRLIGCTVKWPRNTNINGLPAIYSPYEAQLLIDKGIVELRKKAFSYEPNEAIDRQYEEFCEEQAAAHRTIYIENRIDEAKNKMQQILAGKREKVAKTGGDPDQITEQTILEDVRTRAINDDSNVSIQVPTQDPFEVDFEVVKEAPNLDPFKYRVFCDLWGKGHWITLGGTFGGDFLVYPGEPLRYHASYIVHVLRDDEAQSMTSRTFITRTRLSVNVNKMCVFVYENQENKDLCYQTVQWLGK